MVTIVLNVGSKRYFKILMLVRCHLKVTLNSVWCVTSRSLVSAVVGLPTFMVWRGDQEPYCLWQVASRARQGESWVGEVIECTSLPSGHRRLGRPMKGLLYEAETGPLRTCS